MPGGVPASVVGGAARLGPQPLVLLLELGDPLILLLDLISEAFNILSKKYGRGVHFIIAGDTNDLRLDTILSLSPNFRQIVQDWTRLNPPALLDPIQTTLSNYYQVPQCLDPLDPDPDKNGKKSDHRIVLAKPVNIINNRSARRFREVKVRPFPRSGM